MSELADRVRDALHPEFEIAEELGRGGMGMVFLAREVMLRRRVAIKILAPHLASEIAARRFLKEARILAQLTHDHVVTIHSAGERDGLFYYVMDVVEGGTLAGELLAGPLSTARVRKLGRDVLDALESVHDLGVVHRDIKPSNIFSSTHGYKLADFGIASGRLSDEETADVYSAGTPKYMAPEQLVGAEAAPASDLYAVGLVLFEAFTGRQWRAGDDPRAGNWRGVPRGYRPCLRKALAVNPAARWADARVFRHAWRGVWLTVRRVAATSLAAVVLVGGIVLGRTALGPGDGVPGGLRVAVGLPQVAGVAPDSGVDAVLIRSTVANSFSRWPDFDACACDEGGVVIDTHVEFVGSTVQITFASRETSPIVNQRISRPVAQWRTAIDEGGAAAMRDIWQARNRLASRLPDAVVPRTTVSMAAFFEAEEAWHRGRWTDAISAYDASIAADSSCLLCSWRITEAQRWLMQPPDPVHFQRVFQQRERFPPHYRDLILARSQAVDERLETLDRVVHAFPGFYLAWFARGDEWSHRAALTGVSPWPALEDLGTASTQAAGFRPALEHRAWLAITRGDAGTASEALAGMVAIDPDLRGSPMDIMLQLAFAYRFGIELTESAMSDALTDSVLNDPLAPAAPRLLMGFGTPHGAVDLGETFERLGTTQFAFAGAFGQYLGYMALGRLNDAARIAGRIRALDYRREVFDAFDRQLRAQFESLRDAMNGDHGLQWVARRAATPASSAAASILDTALSFARAGAYVRALDATNGLRTAELSTSVVGGDTAMVQLGASLLADPFLRASLHLVRAQWLFALGRSDEAVRELRWHYGSDLGQLPVGPPLAQEADWVLAPHAHWLTARILDGASDPTAACASYAEVVRYWRDGEGRFRQRAEQATQRRNAIGCPTERDPP